MRNNPAGYDVATHTPRDLEAALAKAQDRIDKLRKRSENRGEIIAELEAELAKYKRWYLICLKEVNDSLRDRGGEGMSYGDWVAKSDRIEELESRLAYAVELLRVIAEHPVQYHEPILPCEEAFYDGRREGVSECATEARKYFQRFGEWE